MGSIPILMPSFETIGVKMTFSLPILHEGTILIYTHFRRKFRGLWINNGASLDRPTMQKAIEKKPVFIVPYDLKAKKYLLT